MKFKPKIASIFSSTLLNGIVSQKGVVRFLDSQTGRAASFEGLKDFRLLRTK